jgi:DNA-binding XRE family transcriptional regulator
LFAVNNTGSDFGATLRSLRVHERVKQGDLAERLGLHRNTIGAWERGDYLPDLTTVHQIANLLRLNEQDTNRLFSAHSAKTPLTPPWNIPFLRNVFFTGREEVLQRLHDGLQKHKDTMSILTRSYVLCGLGGIGKTQIAIEYAYRFHHEYRSVFWIQADSHETITASYLAIADILDMPEKNEQDQHRIVKAVIRWLNTHSHWLLIYDNVENFVSVQQMLPTTHLGSILLTTRSQATGSTALPIEIAELSPEEAVSFLLRRAKVLGYDEPLYQVNPADQAAASAIAESLGRLPLALDQAGAYIEEHRCSFSDYLTLYQKHRTVLLHKRGNLGTDHPHSVAVTFALTFAQVQQCNPAAAELLRLSAFLAPDAIPQELLTDGAPYLGPLLQPVATDPLLLDRAFKDLLLSSLIRRSSTHTNTFSIHRLVQVVLRDGMD